MAFFKDLQFGCRSLARTPGFTLLAVLTLGLGIGMSVAVWSIVDAVLIEPLPYPDADRLVEIRMTEPERGPGAYPMSALDSIDFAQRNQTFEAMAAIFRENLNLTGGSTPERVSGAWVSATFLDVLGIAPQIGRSFRAEEDQPGQDLVAIISHGLWQRRFGGQPDIVDSTVVVNGRPHVVVGVMPEGFDFPRDTELWLPIAFDVATEDRAHGWVVPIGRLLPDVHLDTARADLARIAERLEQEYPDTNEGQGVSLVPLKETVVGAVRSSLLVLLAAVACVLLIASANVTILLSVRTAARQRELAVRHALGASRGQLTRLVMIESVLLALCGGAVGLVLAQWGTGLMVLRFAELIPRNAGLTFDARILAVAVLVSVAVGLLAGVLPAIRSREDRIMAQLRESDRSAGRRIVARRHRHGAGGGRSFGGSACGRCPACPNIHQSLERRSRFRQRPGAHGRSGAHRRALQ